MDQLPLNNQLGINQLTFFSVNKSLTDFGIKLFPLSLIDLISVSSVNYSLNLCAPPIEKFF